jgi:hypothetical protein
MKAGEEKTGLSESVIDAGNRLGHRLSGAELEFIARRGVKTVNDLAVLETCTVLKGLLAQLWLSLTLDGLVIDECDEIELKVGQFWLLDNNALGGPGDTVYEIVAFHGSDEAVSVLRHRVYKLSTFKVGSEVHVDMSDVSNSVIGAATRTWMRIDYFNKISATQVILGAEKHTLTGESSRVLAMYRRVVVVVRGVIPGAQEMPDYFAECRGEQIFSDGSLKLEQNLEQLILSERVGTAAAAVVTFENDGKFRAIRTVCSANEYESAYAVEMVALITAELVVHCRGGGKSVINSDCASALRAVVETDHVVPGGSFYLKLLAQFFAKGDPNLTFMKVKAHPERIKGLQKKNWDDKQKGIYMADRVAGEDYQKFVVEGGTLVTVTDTLVRKLAGTVARYFLSIDGILPIVSDVRRFEERALEEEYKIARSKSSAVSWEIMSNKMAAGIFGRYRGRSWGKAVRLMWKIHLTGRRAMKFGIVLNSYACPMCNTLTDDFKHIYDDCQDQGIVDLRKHYDVRLADFFKEAIAGEKYKGTNVFHIQQVRSVLGSGRSTWWTGMFNQEMVDKIASRRTTNVLEDYRVIRDALKITTKGVFAMFKYYKVRTDEVGRWKKSNRQLGSAESLAKWVIKDRKCTDKVVQNAIRETEGEGDSDDEDEEVLEEEEVTANTVLKVLKRCSKTGCKRYVANVYQRYELQEDLIEGEYCHQDDDVSDEFCVVCMRYFDMYDDEAVNCGDGSNQVKQGIG